MGRKGQAITLSITDKEKEELAELARKFAMNWGDQPNISRLIKAIASHELKIAPNHDWEKSRLDALKQGIKALIDTGQPQVASQIANLLLERSELNYPDRLELEKLTKNPQLSWRLELDNYIQRQQPFKLTYQDPSERVWIFHVYHAQINRHDNRFYLDCWCQETEGNRDLPELQHNWCLRLDRITEAAIAPQSGKWHQGLDFVKVEIHLLKGLAFAYQAKSEDIVSELLPQAVKRVVKKVSNSFWFFREIQVYGEDCIIIEPEAIRQGFAEKIRQLLAHYQL